MVIQSSWGDLFYPYHLVTGELRALTSGLDPAISPDGQQIHWWQRQRHYNFSDEQMISWGP